jgi:AcrR family transcriptional regulator
MKQSGHSSDRARGRPADTGQRDLKKQILDKAEELFSHNGYAATSIRRIADGSGVNPALVHYYFSNKKSLLQSVLDRALEPMVLAIAEMKNGSEASPEMISRLLISMAAEHPNIPRLLVREVFLPGGEIQQHFAENMAPRLGGALPALLSREKSAGRLREDCDPAVSAMLLLAVSFFPFIARTLAEPLLGIKYDEDGIEFLNQQITQLLKRGISQ